MLGAAYRFYLGVSLICFAIMIFLLWSLDAFWSWYRIRTKPREQPNLGDLEVEPKPVFSETSDPEKDKPQGPDEIAVLK